MSSTALQQRLRKERRAAQQGRPMRPYRPRVEMSDAAKRARKIERARQYRMEAAQKRGKTFKPRGPKTRYDAHVRCFYRWCRSGKAIDRLLHDAHVIRYRQCLKDRAESYAQYYKDPEKQRARRRRRTHSLPDSYVAEHILHLPLKRCPIELIQAKRAHLKFVRIYREKKSHEIVD